MSVRRWILTVSIAAVVSILAPRPASADWTLTPFVGWNFGGSADINTGSSRSNTSSTFERKLDYGASLATMGRGAVGFEVDFGYSPNFFETSTPPSGFFKFTPDSNVTTLMGNVLIGGHSGPVRPYVVGGVGLIRTKLQDFNQVFSVNSKNDFGLDVGGGLMGFFSRNVGLRGDVRYFRGFRGTSDSSNPSGIALSDFKFWRGSLGLSLKF
jgi:opacity protein-like surface antigen